MEDFRERITKAETGLVVVGGCNDRLIVTGAKKRTDGITQGMVDRCVADEIYEFVSCVLNPNHVPHDSYGEKTSASRTPTASPFGGKTGAGAKGGGAKGSGGAKAANRPSPLAQGASPGVEKKRKKPTPRPKSESDAKPPVTQPNDPVLTAEQPQKSTPAKRPRLSSGSAPKDGRSSTNPSPTPPTPRTPTTRTPNISRSSTPAPPPIPEQPEVVKVKEEPKEPPPAPASQPVTPPSAPVPAPTIDSQPGTPTSADRMYFATTYGESLVNTLAGTSSSRTGRKIRAPRQLDI